MYYSHSGNEVDALHLLVDHLRTVSELTAQFAKCSKLEPEASSTGLLHDIGKYGDLFQDRLRGISSHVDHWSLGAWLALVENHAVASALSIQGHHIGLQNLNKDSLRAIDPSRLRVKHPLQLTLSEPDPEILKDRLKSDGCILKTIDKSILGNDLTSTISRMLDVRMLYSCLVDADFIDTEAHFQATSGVKRHRSPGPPLNPSDTLGILEKHVTSLQDNKSNQIPEKVLTTRKELYAGCINAAENKPGLYTLTAPTGSGKTLAMLAFALKHAAIQGLRRIVCVIPFLSIIEQTASIYREIFQKHFGNEYVLEHHSLAGAWKERTTDDGEVYGSFGERAQLLSENWDAPVIITTSVQMLESLFSNRPSACRKLHRLMHSVILFDEVQTLPANLIVPTLASLSHLAHDYNSTVVFATATQPGFRHLHEPVKAQCFHGWRPKDIIADPIKLFTPLQRTHVEWHDMDKRLTWDSLATILKAHSQALCIVNVKRHAQELWNAMGEPNTLHLSTNMCPAHRKDVLQEVREALEKKDRVHLISTQCIEAGVDVDFPVIWRSYAPLDSIIQAAGRCNREGCMEELGIVHVFMPEDERYPAGYYDEAAQVTKKLVRDIGKESLNLNDPEFITSYYVTLYNLSRPELSMKTQVLIDAVNAGSFSDVARMYRLIPHDSINVVVPYEKRMKEYDHLKETATHGLTREWIKNARDLTVGLYRPQLDDPIWGHMIPVMSYGKDEKEKSDWFIYLSSEHYHAQLGLIPPKKDHIWMI